MSVYVVFSPTYGEDVVRVFAEDADAQAYVEHGKSLGGAFARVANTCAILECELHYERKPWGSPD